ncbi:MAG: glycosyltransferase [Planctomycetes bacterium]|nr:glycosyltransferase [Planctomycetota bacterium]
MVDLILFCFCVLSAIIWLTLLLMPIRWCMSERWEAANPSHVPVSRWPRLSVIVPARNESASLPITLRSWLDQDYPSSEIILIDDESSDGTAECAKGIAAQYGHTMHILNGTKPPPGWTGKLWALEQGVKVSSGEWLLFTDADICHSQNLWRELVAKAVTEHKAMVSLMALLDTNGVWARLLIPAFVYFFYFMYPFEKVSDSQSRTSAAAGGCILVSRSALDKIGGIVGHRSALIDDLALARRIKNTGLPISLSLTKSAVSIRPYCKLGDVWNMVARTAFTQLRRSWLALFGTVLGMIIMFMAPVAGICAFIAGAVSHNIILSSVIALLSMAITYVPTLCFFGLGVWRAFTLPFAGMLYVAMTVSSAVNHLLGWQVWRGVRTKKNV